MWCQSFELCRWGTKQKHTTYSLCIVMQHDTQPSDAVYLPIWIYLKCISLYLSTQAVNKFQHLVNKFKKQEFINIRHLPYFSGFIGRTDAWWPLIIVVKPWNFNTGLILYGTIRNFNVAINFLMVVVLIWVIITSTNHSLFSLPFYHIYSNLHSFPRYKHQERRQVNKM